MLADKTVNVCKLTTCSHVICGGRVNIFSLNALLCIKEIEEVLNVIHIMTFLFNQYSFYTVVAPFIGKNFNLKRHSK